MQKHFITRNRWWKCFKVKYPKQLPSFFAPTEVQIHFVALINQFSCFGFFFLLVRTLRIYGVKLVFLIIYCKHQIILYILLFPIRYIILQNMFEEIGLMILYLLHYINLTMRNIIQDIDLLRYIFCSVDSSMCRYLI